MRLYKIFFLVALMAPTFSMAVTPSHKKDLPDDLLFMGKPINPSCFSILDGEKNNHVYNLKKCSILNKNYKIIYDHYLIKKGFYGAEWKKDFSNKDNDVVSGYNYYRAWPADGNHQYWILTINNSGGSGEFTAMNLFVRKNFETMTLKTVHEGDRCNGGIDIDSIKSLNDGIQFSVNVTAADFLSFDQANPHHLRPYGDLASCAVCCNAKAVYKTTKNSWPIFVRMEFIKNLDVAKMPEQGKYQKCFNQLQQAWVLKGKDRLDLLHLKKFMDQFNTICVKERA